MFRGQQRQLPPWTGRARPSGVLRKFISPSADRLSLRKKSSSLSGYPPTSSAIKKEKKEKGALFPGTARATSAGIFLSYLSSRISRCHAFSVYVGI